MTIEDLPALIRLSFKDKRVGLYWIEAIADRQNDLVVVITDVQGNHGPSAVNGIEEIARQLAKQLPTDRQVRWLTGCEPALDVLQRDEYAEAHLRGELGGVEWTHLSRKDLDAGLVRSLTPLPDNLRALVLANGGEQDDERTYTYRVVQVASLPYPHNLFRCDYADRFATEIADEPENSDDRAMRFYSWLTARRAARCRYHLMDWVAVADASVSILETLGPQPDEESLERAIRDVGLPDAEHAMLRSLFGSDAIAISSDGTYQNGQHRGCGLRLSGASRVVIAGD